MPGARQVADAASPGPRAAGSARVASNLAWYSAVRGACCPRSEGLLGSNGGWPTAPGTMALVHCPVKAGYIASSNARTAALGEDNAATVSTIVPTEPRYRITLLRSPVIVRVSDLFGLRMHASTAAAKRRYCHHRQPATTLSAIDLSEAFSHHDGQRIHEQE